MSKRTIKEIIKEEGAFRQCLHSCLIDGGKDCIQKCVTEALDEGFTKAEILEEVDDMLKSDFKIDAIEVLLFMITWELERRKPPIDIFDGCYSYGE